MWEEHVAKKSAFNFTWLETFAKLHDGLLDVISQMTSMMVPGSPPLTG